MNQSKTMARKIEKIVKKAELESFLMSDILD